MPTYSFRADDDEVIDEYFPMSERPDYGQAIKRNGKVYRRIVELSGAFKREFEHVSHQIPRWHPDAPYHVQSGKDRGKCAFKTERECEEFSAKNPRFSYNKDVG